MSKGQRIENATEATHCNAAEAMLCNATETMRCNFAKMKHPIPSK
jgi:hypothetical protein